MPMKIVFFGSSKFALAALTSIVSSNHELACVVTQPDRLKGRGLALSGTQIKEAAQKHNIRVYQPQDVNSEESAEFLRGLDSDIFVIVAFGQIFSETILAIPKIMPLNIHASILPKYRGAAPVNWALINGDDEAGVSIIKVIAKLDAGPVILQKSIVVTNEDNAQSLRQALSNLGQTALIEALNLIKANQHRLDEQDELKVTFAPKLKKEDGLIHWQKSARDVFNLVRGCAGWPGAFTYFGNKILKIHKISLASSAGQELAGSPGEVVKITNNGIIVATGKGNLLIEELQLEGKKMITAREFVSGYRISVKESFKDKK